MFPIDVTGLQQLRFAQVLSLFTMPTVIYVLLILLYFNVSYTQKYIFIQCFYCLSMYTLLYFNVLYISIVLYCLTLPELGLPNS